MIINPNCCIKLVTLVMSIYDARSHILVHQTCTFCSTAPFYTWHCCSHNMSLCHYVTMSQRYNKLCGCADGNLNTSEHRMVPRWLSRYCDNGTSWTDRSKIANKGKRIFSSTKRTDRISVPPSFLFIGHRVKRQWRKSDCSSKVKKEWIYTTVPPIRLRDVDRNVFYIYV